MPSPTKEPDPDDPNAGQAVNILILGSDQRDGVNAEIGGEVAGMRSDTTMVLHISADRSRVELVSIPRDSLVDIPSCTMTNGKTTRATHGMFNSAFATGWDNGGDMTSAAACTINTVQQNTGRHRSTTSSSSTSRASSRWSTPSAGCPCASRTT